MSQEIMKRTSMNSTFTEELKGTASEVINQIRRLLREGNARRLMIQNKKGKILFQTQLTAGLAGTALFAAMAPIVSAIGMFALFMNDVKIIVEKYPEEEQEDDNDEFEVDAEVIEVKDEEETDKEKEGEEKEDRSEKTVGKKDTEE